MTKYLNKETGIYRLSYYLVYTLIVATLCGCGALITGKAWLDSSEVKPSSSEVVVSESVKTERVIDNANKFALMALFAKVVYRKDLLEKVRDIQGCAYLTKDAPLPPVGMPRKHDGSGWKRWKGTEDVKACINEGGLSYETYVHETSNGILDEAVIAFRGTENYMLREVLEDWGTNLSAVVGVEPPEYIAVQRLIPKLIDKLHLQWPKIPIYVTGHSLGGGLAQQAAYIDRRIVEVYAFDPTPVTNWSILSIRNTKAMTDCTAKIFQNPDPDPGQNAKAIAACKELIIQNPDPKIYRIYHWHEGLAYVRNVTSRFNTRRFGRSDYEFYFQEVPPIAAHEMGILACHLSQSIQGPEADHGYTKEFALTVIGEDYGKPYPEHPVCPRPAVVLPCL